jgi:tetratricopeptide (TPR) repeat protein
MANPNIDDHETLPNFYNSEPRITGPQPNLPDENVDTPAPRKPRRWLWVLGGLLVLLLMTASGGYAGYRTALSERLEKESANVAMVALTQFQIGLDDLAAGRYETARDRFEYVIELDPSFPGAVEKLSEALLAMAIVNTPTPRPTPTIEITPTPDLRGAEELYDTALQHLRAKEWDMAIQTLDRLRQEDLSYRTLDVDGMYFIALRHRGVQKIIFAGNLEGGMYDLSLTERFGPLDHEANGFRNWARMYVSGASFWEVDWERVLSYFSQIYLALPNLRDGSNITAVERFRRASIGYGDQLMEAEEYCLAIDQYNNALSITDDPEVRTKKEAAFSGCFPPEPTASPRENTPVPTPGDVEVTPTPGEGEEPTPEPTETTESDGGGD